MSLACALQGFGFSVWIDREYLSQHILGENLRGVDESAVFVACINPTCIEKAQAGVEGGANIGIERRFANLAVQRGRKSGLGVDFKGAGRLHA